ncbi:hypothetical protein [Rhodococcus sp. Leaf278]|uniref:hypothetical protein n=1 Tax=Rhodococcus sp. Leaf278 TaxID=1736319 RepID=UPI000A61148F|nr:hypothetical protein [Rhodococcus sp. Leaf278]
MSADVALTAAATSLAGCNTADESDHADHNSTSVRDSVGTTTDVPAVAADGR